MDILTLIIGIFAVALAALLTLYFFAPRTLFQWAQKSLRRKGGLVEKSIEAGGFTWPYLEGGPADGEVVVLVHGFAGDKDNWAMFSPYITKKYRFISMDLPGFGENDRSMDRDYTIPLQVERLRQFLDALGIAKCHIGGNSMGGHISLQFALSHPEYLKSLTLYNNAGVMGTTESELQTAVEKGENALAIQSVEDVKRMIAFVTHKPARIPAQFRKIFFEDADKYKDLLDKIFWSIVETAVENPLNDQLGNLTVPTLIIWGRHDRLIHVSCAEVIHANVPDSELVIFEDVGHIPMIEKPKQTAETKLAFLAKH